MSENIMIRSEAHKWIVMTMFIKMSDDKFGNTC